MTYPRRILALAISQARNLPNCRLDPKFGTIDLDMCKGLLSLIDDVSKGVKNPEVVCEPACARQWAQVQCRKEVLSQGGRIVKCIQ